MRGQISSVVVIKPANPEADGVNLGWGARNRAPGDEGVFSEHR